MKIGVWAYLDNNIGDDLMIKLLAENFNEHTFHLYSDRTVVKNTFSKFNNIFVKNSNELENDLESIKVFISIGGSIFNNLNNIKGKLNRLNRIRFIRKLKIKKIKVATIGCNLGPYNDNIGLYLTKLELKMNDLVTVRDKSSYELIKNFKSIRNFHLADDIVYNLNKKNESSIKTTGLGITVYRSLKLKDCNYPNYVALAKITDEFIRKTNKSVRLFAFDSENENDISAAHHVFDIATNKDRIEIIPYLGDIDGFIDKMSECERFISIRFHGAILSNILGIPFLPIIYSNKMNDFLTDNKYEQELIKLENLTLDSLDVQSTIDKIIDGKDLFSSANVSNKNGKLHFEELRKLFDK